jgi:hypothetical protein
MVPRPVFVLHACPPGVVPETDSVGWNVPGTRYACWAVWLCPWVSANVEGAVMSFQSRLPEIWGLSPAVTV